MDDCHPEIYILYFLVQRRTVCYGTYIVTISISLFQHSGKSGVRISANTCKNSSIFSRKFLITRTEFATVENVVFMQFLNSILKFSQ